VITDNSVEKLEIVKEDELYGLVHLAKNMYPEWRKETVIALNSKEIDAIVKFRNDTKEH